MKTKLDFALNYWSAIQKFTFLLKTDDAQFEIQKNIKISTLLKILRNLIAALKY